MSERVKVPLKRVTASEGSEDGGFEIDCKRLYLPLVVVADCPQCGQEIEHDLSEDYLSYPEVGAPFVVGFHHEHEGEDHEFGVEVVLKVNIEAAPAAKPVADEKTEPLPSYGDHMTLEKFVEHVVQGMFIDYDGSGNYATATAMYSDLTVSPSDVTSGDLKTQFTHVVWFNK
jgi:hypothetical protein